MKQLLYFKFFIYALAMLLFSLRVSAAELSDPENALKDYVALQDGVFKIQSVVSIPGQGYTAHLYNLTSQQWLTEAEVDKSIWTHSLVIIIPDVVNSKTSMLLVAGNDNDDPLPDASDPVVQIITQLALGSQSIVSAIYQIPNQPVIFDADGIPRKEDKLVALTWKKAMDTGNYMYPAYLPMVKSVVKAMDGIQAVVSSHGDYQIDDFVLSGFSKRGATVWLSAAIDPRVKAIAPGVIDFLNLAPSVDHHYKSYGAYSSAIDDYIDLGVLQKVRSPEFTELLKVIDPYSYLDQLSMPKYLLNSSGDQFFLPDSSRFYYDDLLGEKLLRFAPNTDHSLNNSETGVTDTLYSLLGWYQSVIYGVPRPELNWQLENNRLIASSSTAPVAVKVWSAYNAAGRDFRKDTIGESWSYRLLSADAQGEYSVELPVSTTGFNATYLEFIYQGLSGLPVTYSTQVYVTPDVYPYAFNNPVLDPGASNYWQTQVKKIINNKPADLDEATLLSYLPVPLFDSIVSDIDGVSKALSVSPRSFFHDIAERECLSTRLNLAADELGWYSEIDLGGHLGNKLFWQHYQLASDNYQYLPILSSYICAQINNQ